MSALCTLHNIFFYLFIYIYKKGNIGRIKSVELSTDDSCSKAAYNDRLCYANTSCIRNCALMQYFDRKTLLTGWRSARRFRKDKFHFLILFPFIILLFLFLININNNNLIDNAVFIFNITFFTLYSFEFYQFKMSQRDDLHFILIGINGCFRNSDDTAN